MAGAALDDGVETGADRHGPEGTAMNITIIGYGNMARAIGARAVAAGHALQIVGRDTGKATALAHDLGGDIVVGSLDDELIGDLVIPAMHYGPLMDITGRLRDKVAGKIVVDITNPVNAETFDGMLPPDGSSGAQEVRERLPDARVVKAFNTTLSGPLTAGEVEGRPLDVLVAADDENAKRTVMELAESLGLRPLDAGPLRRAREVEAIGFLQMAMQGALGNTWMTTFKLLGP
ncbi:NADPH-dependent F420 reductase [Georgenia sp. AZ-5]|uniref:NADPH-dependent F420 reductase n=1 Tax=Georgenia sp. AZ-5 TaxID=3367526 RepID=UPI0037552D4E